MDIKDQPSTNPNYTFTPAGHSRSELEEIRRRLDVELELTLKKSRQLMKEIDKQFNTSGDSEVKFKQHTETEAPAIPATSPRGKDPSPIGLPWPLQRENAVYGQNEVRARFQQSIQKPRVMPDKFDGHNSWKDYYHHFESCKVVNNWGDEEAVRFLAASPRGPALKLLHEHPGKVLTYSELTDRLRRRFAPPDLAENYLMELRHKRRGPKETIQELGQKIRELTTQAYPEFDEQGHDRLARGHFMDAITR